MKINKIDITIIVILLLLVLVFVIIQNYSNKSGNTKNDNYEIDNNNKTTEEIGQEYEKNKENLAIYNDNSTIDQLKEEYKMEGDNQIYQIETENDGRKVINVKTEINYKVAFAGMIKEEIPDFQEIDSICNEKHPKKNGIWIKENDRNKIVNFLNNNSKLKSGYSVDKDGYLQQKQDSEKTELDNKINRLINEPKQYIVSISSKCYMVDVVTGSVVEYRYNDLDCYQTYEYFEDKDKMIIFISENKEKKLKEEEIFDSIARLL